MGTLDDRDASEPVSEILRKRAAAGVVARLAERDRSKGPSTDEIVGALDDGRVDRS